MKRHMGACLLAVTMLWSAGCLVHGLCHTDEDCVGNETCDNSGECRVQCTGDTDCYVNGQPVGKECFHFRCQWRLDERVTAPDFCLDVVNPKSSHYNKNLCLSALKGKVVLIYFALMS